MKDFIKRILGERGMFWLREIRTSLFPKPYQKEQMDLEKLLLPKRLQFYSTFIKKGDLVFDVGANFGNRVAPFLKLGAKVLAVEPQEECYKYLKYKFGNKILLENRALGEQQGEKAFYTTRSTTISTFSEDWLDAVKDGRFKGNTWEYAGEITMTTLDNLIRQYGKPDYIKIDVEGYELEVLKGLSEVVPMISIEYTVPEQTGKALSCIELLHQNYPSLEFNYSEGESMSWSLDQWCTYEEMRQVITSERFRHTSFGDIYIRLKQPG